MRFKSLHQWAILPNQASEIVSKKTELITGLFLSNFNRQFIDRFQFERFAIVFLAHVVANISPEIQNKNCSHRLTHIRQNIFMQNSSQFSERETFNYT